MTFKSFVIGELYIFIILQKNLEGEQIWRIILYIFYMFSGHRDGECYVKYFNLDMSGDV